jgi:hypothetical protein
MNRTALAALLLWTGPAAADTIVVSGAVTSEETSLAGAIVCGIDWDASGRVAMPPESCAVTDATGAFEVETTLVTDGRDWFGQITAGAPGYLTVDLYVPENETTDVPLTVVPVGGEDNPDYRWWPATGDRGCGFCHGAIADQWLESRHSIAAVDPWVFDLYNGTDADGNEAAPGYKLEHDDAGECGACHAATASWSAGEVVDLNEIPAEHRDGVFCETCHKILDVEPGAGPGVDGSITLWRPGSDFSDGQGGYWQFAFGPYPNVIGHSMLSSYSPLFRSARLCAGCHEYTNRNGVAVMETYSDWLAVGDPEETKPCEGCHMQDAFGIGVEGMEWVVEDPHLRQMSAQRRDPEEIFRHEFFGGQQWAPFAMELLLEAEQQGDELVVRTTAINVGANHRVPTGMPFREILLSVVAEPATGGEPLELVSGPAIAPRGGDLAGTPGKVFAKSLGDESGALTFAFWDATQILEDNRLAPGERDESEFRFAIPGGMWASVTARLLYRRASQPLADAKGWDMEEQEIGHAEESVELTVEEGGVDAGSDASVEPDVQTGCACRQAGAAGAGPGFWLVGLVATLALLERRARRRSAGPR